MIMKNKITRYTITLLLGLVMLISLVGCDNTDDSNDNSVDMQFVSEMVEESKKYADKCFEKHLSNKNQTKYEIKHSNYGFISYNPMVFAVGYEYIVDDSQYLYGYKLILNDDLSFSVIGEGETAAEFIMNTNSIDYAMMINDKKIILNKQVWESDQTLAIDRNANNVYVLILPEGASIYRWKAGEVEPIYAERFQYIFDEDYEGSSLYAQKYVFDLDDDISEFEIKLINIDDVDKNYEQAEGKVFKFYLK